MTHVTILHEAEVELWDTVAFYEDKSPGLGLDFAAEIERSMQIIVDFPEISVLHADGTRRYLAHRFPYLIIYTSQDDHVWILAIAHCKRRPAYWRSRIQKTKTGESGN